MVGGINAFNMIDGIDGLSGSLALVSLITIAVMSWFFQNWLIYYYCLVLIAAITAFLLFNLRIFGRKTAAIFLGDAGSTLLGFSVCWLAISASHGEKAIFSQTAVLWLMAVPLWDSISVMCRRISNGHSPFEPDREHLHHFLATLGFGVNQNLMIIVSVATIFSIISMVSSLILIVPEQVLFFTFLTLFAAYYWYVDNAWKKVVKISTAQKQDSENAELKTKDISN